jgi:hypothetical protein
MFFKQAPLATVVSLAMTHATLLVRITQPPKYNLTHAPSVSRPGLCRRQRSRRYVMQRRNARLVNGHTTIYARIEKCDNRVCDCAYCKREGNIPTNWAKAFWGADDCLNSEGKNVSSFSRLC